MSEVERKEIQGDDSKHVVYERLSKTKALVTPSEGVR